MLLREHGEPVTYFPFGSVTGRSITAIVERNVEVPSESGDQVSYAIICRVLDDETDGILATEIDDGRDEISLPLITGGPAKRRSITRTMDDANGAVKFMVR